MVMVVRRRSRWKVLISAKAGSSCQVALDPQPDFRNLACWIGSLPEKVPAAHTRIFQRTFTLFFRSSPLSNDTVFH